MNNTGLDKMIKLLPAKAELKAEQNKMKNYKHMTQIYLFIVPS